MSIANKLDKSINGLHIGMHNGITLLGRLRIIYINSQEEKKN